MYMVRFNLNITQGREFYREENKDMVKMHLDAARANVRPKMTQKQAAEAVGISEATMISWEKEERFPSSIQLQKLCNLYGCSIADIFIPEELG